jgi:hypothetical protein
VRRLIPSLVTAATLLVSPATAEEFSWQVEGGVSDAQIGSSADGETASLSGTYFFRPVDDATGPYALAPFLERASHIGASYHEDKTTAVVPVFNSVQIPLPPSPPATIVTRASGRALSGRHVFGDAGWYVGARFVEADAAHPAPLQTSFDVFGDEMRSRSVSFGRYLGRATAIGLSLETAEASAQTSLSLPCTGLLCAILPRVTIVSTVENEHENVSIAAQHVGTLGRMHYALSGTATTNRAETSRELTVTQPSLPPPSIVLVPPPAGGLFLPPAGGVAVAGLDSLRRSSERQARYEFNGELFPTQALGVRVGYARWDGEPALDDSYELGATWFFRRNVGAELVLTRTKADLPIATVLDLDTVGIRFIGRL